MTDTMLLWLLWVFWACGSGYHANKNTDDRYENPNYDDDSHPQNSDGWHADLLDDQTSSSTIQLHWNAPTNTNVDHLEITHARLNNQGYATEYLTISLDANTQEYTFGNLRPDSIYQIEITACIDEHCFASLGSTYNTIFAQTEPEQWIFDGEDIFSVPAILHLDSAVVTIAVAENSIIIDGFLQGLQRWIIPFDNTNSLDTETTSVLTDAHNCWNTTCLENTTSPITAIESPSEVSSPSAQGFLVVENNAVSFWQEDSCGGECILEEWYTQSNLLPLDVTLLSTDALLIRGTSMCDEPATSNLYFTQQINASWEIQTDEMECPQAWIEDVQAVQSPKYDSTTPNAIMRQLYLQQNGEVASIYTTNSSEAVNAPENWSMEETRNELFCGTEQTHTPLTLPDMVSMVGIVGMVGMVVDTQTNPTHKWILFTREDSSGEFDLIIAQLANP